MDVLDIKTQKLSLLLANFQVCHHCRVVDIAQDRVGHKCSVCGKSGEGGTMYFELSVHILINLIQETFHASNKQYDEETEITIETDAHNISVVLFFCTLREVLLNHLITELCRAQKIPKLVSERLLADNIMYTQRQEKLLPSLVGKKWKKLINEETNKAELDYVKLNAFLEKAVGARNEFMHQGRKWNINREIAEDCLRHISPLLNFYVGLHNHYVHPYFYAENVDS
jgi:hypothetical protein